MVSYSEIVIIMRKKTVVSLLVLLLVSCQAVSPPHIYTWLQKRLSESCVSTKGNFLVLFISERMCAACISQEIININQSNLSKPILVVGVFERNRYFQSVIGSILEDKFVPLFINVKEYTPERLPLQPFYSVFDYQTQTIINIFYPPPCEPWTTLQYLQEMDDKLTLASANQ